MSSNQQKSNSQDKKNMHSALGNIQIEGVIQSSKLIDIIEEVKKEEHDNLEKSKVTNPLVDEKFNMNSPKPNDSITLHSKLSEASSGKEVLSPIAETYNGLLDLYNVNSIRTVSQALSSPSKSISLALKENKQQTTEILKYAVAKTIRSLNVSNNMDISQIPDAIEIITYKYYYLKFTEIVYVLRAGLMGEYGKIFNNFDITILCQWFNDYAEEREQIVEQKSYLEHDKHAYQEKSRQYDLILKQMDEKMQRDQEKENRTLFQRANNAFQDNPNYQNRSNE